MHVFLKDNFNFEKKTNIIMKFLYLLFLIGIYINNGEAIRRPRNRITYSRQANDCGEFSFIICNKLKEAQINKFIL